MSDKQTDAPQKRVHWANDYEDFRGDWYDSREEANNVARDDRIAVIRREQTGDKIEYYKENV